MKLKLISAYTFFFMMATCSAMNNQSISDENFLDTLHNAAIHGKLSEVKKMIEAKPQSLTQKNEFKRTVLHYAVLNYHLDIVTYLLDKMKDNPEALLSLKDKDYEGESIFEYWICNQEIRDLLEKTKKIIDSKN
jgi:ankyrin repeat protein